MFKSVEQVTQRGALAVGEPPSSGSGRAAHSLYLSVACAVRVSSAIVVLCASSSVGSADMGTKPWSGLGRAATAGEIAAWDTDVRPDGAGLPKGRGSVAEGQALYDEKCASCHGEFGESNQYLQLAGGVGSLASETPLRTTGSKLNYATTLWDYINRAMPFQAPKTLSANEVYALTAYTLHLNDILPAEASLDERSILAVIMPNAAGFTLEHGFMRKDGKPDVRAEACMQNCATAAVTSSMPDYARDSHGDLAQQTRGIGPWRGIAALAPNTTQQNSFVAQKKRDVSDNTDASIDQSKTLELLKINGCMVCHGLEQRMVGPAFQEVAQRYHGQAGNVETLSVKLRKGGAGAWGPVPMPPQPQLSDNDVRAIVSWIIAGARAP